MKSLGRILVFTKKLTPYYIIIVVASLFVTAAGIAVPFIIGRATDAAVAAVAGTVSITQATTTVLWLAGAFFAVDVLSTMISSVGGYFGDTMAARLRAIRARSPVPVVVGFGIHDAASAAEHLARRPGQPRRRGRLGRPGGHRQHDRRLRRRAVPHDTGPDGQPDGARV